MIGLSSVSTAKEQVGFGGVLSSFFTILAKRSPQPLHKDLQLSGPLRHSIVSVVPHLWQKNAAGFLALALLRGFAGALFPCISIVQKKVAGPPGERGEAGQVSGDDEGGVTLPLRLGEASSLLGVALEDTVAVETGLDAVCSTVGGGGDACDDDGPKFDAYIRGDVSDDIRGTRESKAVCKAVLFCCTGETGDKTGSVDGDAGDTGEIIGGGPSMAEAAGMGVRKLAIL